MIDLRFGSRRMLFTGDMEEEIDPQLISRGLARHLGGPIDVLKVAHHGSGTATTDALLDFLQPRIAVISVGADNNYGHPAPATLERLRSHGAHGVPNGSRRLGRDQHGRPRPGRGHGSSAKVVRAPVAGVAFVVHGAPRKRLSAGAVGKPTIGR